MTEGILVIDKPDGVTSHDVVARVRKRFKMKKVGHAGTLDPLATGVLVVLLGKATKLSNKFTAFDKAYRATMVLGTKTTTADKQGEVIEQRPYDAVTPQQLAEVVGRFRGEIQQVPPMYSAVKHKGRKLYELARKGIEVEREPRSVTIHKLLVGEINLPEVKFYVECSKGTYIRQLAADIGDALGCGACISQIQRTKVGRFALEDAVTLEDMNEDCIRHWSN
ncbi:MAG: tRNA pseudouridine(55) synthase TruB [Candidatus Omnitrophica bacterium]|nr:tRNA pseudouridine(55) synthase TruB [Candidatus Omnitrophota bacterium]MCB9720829.1 tRNA pseudouridine(55) synthase TruB [Candidatus Omnitrophota bacterium]